MAISSPITLPPVAAATSPLANEGGLDLEVHMYNYDKNLVPRSRELPTNATRQEKHLWYDFLNTYPVRCHHQKIIGEYIVDFYCPQGVAEGRGELKA